MEKKDLQKHSTNISEKLIQITANTDLLIAKPINEQILAYGRNEVNVEIAKYANKCINSLGLEMDNFTTQTLVEDIVEKYKWDSIEDIRECFKKGRQGYYGKIYGKLNMIVFSEWMAKHLEEKAIAREKQHDQRTKELYKHNWINRDQYAASVARDLYTKKPFNFGFIDEEYQKFKADYEAKKMIEKKKDSI